MTSTSGLKKRGDLPPQAPNQQKSIIEIYTDWANHYLDKLHGGRKKVKDLQTELQDGLILAEVIEAVMSQKVPEIHKKPKSPGQMVENLQNCLNFLAKKGVAVQDIQALDIKDGHLKAILGLFFQLSRFKQQQKMILQERSSTPKIPSVPASPARGASAIPSPIHRNKPGLSRIPAPPGQRSMLDKLRSGAPAPLRDVKKGLGKRTSSSSGFSSARSIGSESSISLSSDTNFPSPSALRRINETSQAGNSPKNKKSIPTIKAQSPKRSPKLQPRNTEIKDYGPVDGHQYPPHHANNKTTNIPKVSKIPSSASKISSRIPSAAKNNASEVAVDKSKLGIEIVTTTTVNRQDKQTLPSGENEAELASQMSASLQSKNKSLPRTKRREESPGPSNVAVVSPMPSSKTDEELDKECSSTKKPEESIVVNEDQAALKALVPLGPLGLFPTTKKATHQLPFSSHRMEPLTTLATFSSSHQPSGSQFSLFLFTVYLAYMCT